MAFTSKYINKHKELSFKLRNGTSEKHSRFTHNISPVSLSLVRSSDDLLPKCRSPTIKKQKQLAITVSELLSCTNKLQKSHLAFKLLLLCSEEEGSYSKEMKIVVNTISDSLFIHKEEVDGEVLSKVYENYTEAIFSSNSIPVIYVLEAYSEVLNSYKSKNFDLSSKYSQISSDLKHSLNEKDQQIESLQKFIQNNISEPLNKKINEIKGVEDRYSSACKSIDELKEIIETNEIIIKKLRQQNSNNTKTIYNHQCEEEKNKVVIEELNKNISNLQKEIKNLQEENYKKQYFLEITLLKIKASVEREKFLEVRNADLETENQNLAQIFGNGASYLTPRPSFAGLDMIFKDAPPSTQAKVQKLIKFVAHRVKGKTRAGLKKLRTIKDSSLASSKLEISSRYDEKETNFSKNS